MRTVSTFFTLMAFTAAASAAVSHSKYDFEGYSDPTEFGPPPANTQKWSYWPNSAGVCTGSPPSVGCCGKAAGKEACGPLNWQYFSADTAKTCTYPSGGQQSPINLDAGEGGYESLSKADGQLKFSKPGKCAGEIVAKNSTWEIEFKDCEPEFTVTVDGEEWKLYQMHVHGPSEHTVNGMYYPIEIHMVHLPVEGPANRGLVLGVFLTPGKANSILSIFDNEDAGYLGEAFKAFNPYALLPKGSGGGYYHYTGSLTTPGLGGVNLGCQLNADGANGAFNKAVNNISWYVFKKPQTASASQLAWFTDYFCELKQAYLCQINRPVQAIHNKIYSYGKTAKW